MHETEGFEEYREEFDQVNKLQVIEEEWRNGTGESIDEALAEAFK